MLTRMRLRNFRSWVDTGDVALRPITGFFGANSSGKSSLLHVLLLLKQTAESPDRRLVFRFGDKAAAVDLGDMNSVVYRHDPQRKLEIGLDWECAKRFMVVDSQNQNETVADSQQLGYSVVAGQAERNGVIRPMVEELTYTVGGAAFGMRRKAGKETEYDLFGSSPDNQAFRFVHSVGREGSAEGASRASIRLDGCLSSGRGTSRRGRGGRHSGCARARTEYLSRVQEEASQSGGIRGEVARGTRAHSRFPSGVLGQGKPSVRSEDQAHATLRRGAGPGCRVRSVPDTTYACPVPVRSRGIHRVT